MSSSERITAILAMLGVIEAVGVVFTVALCRAAARRPVCVPRRSGDE